MSRYDLETRRQAFEALTPAEQSALVQSKIREAHAMRALAIRGALRAVWRATARITWRFGRTAATALAAALEGYWDRHRRRLAAAQLHAMDDRMLQDIGLRRSEIDFVVSGVDDPTRRPRRADLARRRKDPVSRRPSPPPLRRAA